MHMTFVTWLAVVSLAWFLIGLLLGRLWQNSGVAKPASAGTTRGGAGKTGPVELYVGNIAYDTSDDELAKAFGRFGKVMSTRIITKKTNGQPKGYGFVDMSTREEAAAAVRGMHGKELGGRVIVVNEAKSRGRFRR